MTPIKVPGKKTPKKHCEPGQSGRRLPIRSTRHFSSPSLRDAYRTTNPNPTVRRLSRLERLPTELLEIIFFQCLNLNLPLASPILSSALSSFHVKSRLLFKAFESGLYPGLLHSENLISILHDKIGVQELQDCILNLKWMTLDFLHQCIPIYLEKTLMHAFKTLQLCWMDGTPANDLTRAKVAKFVKEAFENSKLDDEFFCESLYQFESGYSAVELRLNLSDGAVSLKETGPTYTFQNWKLLYCLEGCSIPEKALRGPWTAERCELLSILIRGEAEVDWIDSTSGELVERSFPDALRERNYRAIELLMIQNPGGQSGMYGHYTYDSVHGWVAKSNVPAKGCRRTKRSKGVDFHANMEHFRAAAIQYDSSKAILECIRGNVGPMIQYGDKLLTSWALQKQIEGDERGPWMLSVLEKPSWAEDSCPEESCHGGC